MAKIAAIAWAANNLKLAICTSDRIIHLFDEMGEKKDKFSTKPVEPKVNPSNILGYILRFIAVNTFKVTWQAVNDLSLIFTSFFSVWQKKLCYKRYGIFTRFHKDSSWANRQYHICIQNRGSMVRFFIRQGIHVSLLVCLYYLL